MAQLPKAHLLVVDDDDRIRDLLQTYLRRHGYLVSTAPGAARARRLLATMRFDLIVLDIMMPGEDGISLTRHIGQTCAVPVLLLTAMGEASQRIDGLRAGADDYLPKPFEPEELLLRIGAILRRAQDSLPDDSVLGFGPWTFALATSELHGEDGLVPLTGGEAKLLAALARHPGEAISRESLSARAHAEPRSVDVQIARLRRKLEADPRHPRYVQTVRGAGYCLHAKALPGQGGS